MELGAEIVVSKHLAHASALAHSDTAKSAPSMEQAAKRPDKNEVDVGVGEEGQNLDDSATEANQKRMKHLTEVQNDLDEKDKKLKDMQMNRLQSKLRYFIRIEKELRQKIRDVTEKDENLITILEDAICFGKVLFVIKPVVSQQVSSIQAKVEAACETLYAQRDHEHQDDL